MTYGAPAAQPQQFAIGQERFQRIMAGEPLTQQEIMEMTGGVAAGSHVTATVFDGAGGGGMQAGSMVAPTTSAMVPEASMVAPQASAVVPAMNTQVEPTYEAPPSSSTKKGSKKSSKKSSKKKLSSKKKEKGCC